MTSFISRVDGQPTTGYREESARHAIIIALSALVLAGAAMGLFSRQRFYENSLQTSIISKLGTGTKDVGRIVEDIRNAIKVEPLDVALKPVPQPVPQPVVEPVVEFTRLPGTISGVMWNESNPLVIVDGELHPVGDKVTYTLNNESIGFTIVNISKEKVVFRNPFGEEFEELLYNESDQLKTE